MASRHLHDADGFLVVLDNSERCRDCGVDDQNIWYEERDAVGRVISCFALCRKDDPDRDKVTG